MKRLVFIEALGAVLALAGAIHSLLPTTSTGKLGRRGHNSAGKRIVAWDVGLRLPAERRGAAGDPPHAARVYQRDGAVDWHGFARHGAHTGGSVGAATAWVASEALELHASSRYLNAADRTVIEPVATGLVRSNPWSDATARHAKQLLVGGTWTNAEQLSVLAEAWWDGAALSDAQWSD